MVSCTSLLGISLGLGFNARRMVGTGWEGYIADRIPELLLCLVVASVRT